jgi:hypothetical protein
MKILLLAANPKDTTELLLGKEARNIKEGLNQTATFSLGCAPKRSSA